MQVYFNNKLYKRLDKNEVIESGALHMVPGSQPLKEIDPDTYGDRPDLYSKNRVFFNPVKE